MTTPFITILVPTRERCETLGPALKTCVTQNYDKLAIVVADNCSTDRTAEVVSAIADCRVRYVKAPRRLSMTANFEFALSHARPGYVVSIGDDDGLMPGAIEAAADVIRQTATPAVTSPSPLYHWPNFPIKSQQNLLFVGKLAPGLTEVSSREIAAERAGFRHPKLYCWGLPTLYRGFVSTDVIHRATKNGRYFRSITPDAYSGFVNSFFIDRYCRVGQPLIIEGVSGRSNGVSQLVGRDDSEEMAYLSENDLIFHRDLAYAPASAIILAEAFLQARDAFPDRASGLEIDIARVCWAALREARGGINQPRIEKVVSAILGKHQLSRPRPLSRAQRIQEIAGRFQRTILTRVIEVSQYGVADVFDAAAVAQAAIRGEKRFEGTSGTALAIRKIMAKLAGRRDGPDWAQPDVAERQRSKAN